MSADVSNPGLKPFSNERRRSDRYPLFTPIRVSWTGPGHQSHSAQAQARQANLHGGLLQFLDAEKFPVEGTEIELHNLLSGQKAKARVTAARRSQKGTLLALAVELLPPNEEFWGLTFQLKRTTSELLKLEQGIKSGDIDSFVLREFRDAVDYVRKTAWAVQEWQERQLQKRDTATVIPLLVAERLRRGTQLYDAITSDLKNHTIRPEAEEVGNLFQAVERLYIELKDLR